jgi:hypothetical protein
MPAKAVGLRLARAAELGSSQARVRGGNKIETIENYSKILAERPGHLGVGLPEGENAMTERQFRDLETQIARCRFLEQEVTDPLAACLVHLMILELEADLRIVGPIRQPWAKARRS